jgi:hypothetical protein
MSKVIGYIIPKDFKGYALTTVCRASTGHEFVAHSNLSLDDYLAIHSDAHVVSPEDFNALYSAHLETIISQPVEISRERFIHMLEVMPPSRRNSFSDVEMFHHCERHTGNIVSWFAQYKGVFFEFMDTDNKTGFEISEKVKIAYTQLQKVEV